jgi:hypothetical protein
MAPAVAHDRGLAEEVARAELGHGYAASADGATAVGQDVERVARSAFADELGAGADRVWIEPARAISLSDASSSNENRGMPGTTCVSTVAADLIQRGLGRCSHFPLAGRRLSQSGRRG